MYATCLGKTLCSRVLQATCWPYHLFLLFVYHCSSPAWEPRQMRCLLVMIYLLPRNGFFM